MATIFANCRGYKIEDEEDGTVSEQVENGLRFSLVSVIMEKYKKCMRLRLLGDKKANKMGNMSENRVFARGK